LYIVFSLTSHNPILEKGEGEKGIILSKIGNLTWLIL